MEKIFQTGKVIVEENSFGQSAFVIKSGKVEVSKKNKKGEKVILAVLGERQIFGEMGLIEDKPRSATVTALEEVRAEEIGRDLFNELLKKEPEAIFPVLKLLFERLRCIDEMLIEENRVAHETLASAVIKKVILVGASKETLKILKNKELEITKFPFCIGRESHSEEGDALANNDFYLKDRIPYNVSRNHFSINRLSNLIYVFDRGSTLGTIVNGIRIGGPVKKNDLILEQEENLIIIGTPESPFQFRLLIRFR